MTIAAKLRHFLDRQGAVYEIIPHRPTQSARETALVCDVPADCFAKAVLVDTPDEPLLAVLPADCRVEMDELGSTIGETPQIADEREVVTLFDDCAPGAIPPLGQGYGVAMIVDAHLDDVPEVYFEGGDHMSIVHVSHDEFARLTREARHGEFGTPVRFMD